MSFDAQQKNRAFSEKFSFNYPLLCDTDRSMGRAYHAKPRVGFGARRVGVIIDPDGKIADFEAKADSKSYPSTALSRIPED